MSFKDKVVIVTGAGAGIGAATAKIFAKESAKVAIVDINEEKLKKVEHELKEYTKNRPLSILADVSNDEECRNIVKKTVKHFGELHILINNAGIVSYISIFDPDYIKQYDRIVSVNLRAAVLLTNAALPYLIKTKGNIINVSSAAAISPMALGSHYCASKAGLDHFSRAIAIEAAERGVRVNVINPGPVKTDIHATYGMNDVQIGELSKHLPLGFISESEEIGNMIKFLASDLAKSVTGSSYVIDGGLTVHGFNSVVEKTPKSK